MQHESIVILDFGSQYTQLIARRIRARSIFSVVLPYSATQEEIHAYNPKGIILSGGPSSVYDEKAPKIEWSKLELGVPVLGICYGMQLITQLLGGRVERAERREYGLARLTRAKDHPLLEGISQRTDVWMSHGDHVLALPEGFEVIGTTENCPNAAVACDTKKIYALQYHPEVSHTTEGPKLIDNFLDQICGMNHDWTMASFVDEAVEKIQRQVGEGKVVLGLSGGVDSSVAAILLHKAIGDNLTCIFVDNGLLRKDERKQVEERFRGKFKLNLIVEDASEEFMTALAGVIEPERKRKIIGEKFIRVFERVAMEQVGPIDFLAQGTLYPDVIESVSVKGPSATIKSHHNVGGLPKDMKFKLVEPLKDLFKDEVRALGAEMGMDKEILWRQPFPGPGLAVRILGDVTRERCDLLREADAIIVDEIKKAGRYYDIWQSFGVLLPVKSVGVMGDERTYEDVIAVRAVNSHDGMTADWVDLPHELLALISNRIINEVRGVNRVVYDISSKPPATIEWE